MAEPRFPSFGEPAPLRRGARSGFWKVVYNLAAGAECLSIAVGFNRRIGKLLLIYSGTSVPHIYS